MIEAKFGEIVFVNVTATDNNSFTFYVLNKPQGASLSHAGNLLNFTWNVTSSDKVKILFFIPVCQSFVQKLGFVRYTCLFHGQMKCID